VMRSRPVAAAEDLHLPAGHGPDGSAGRRSFDTAMANRYPVGRCALFDAGYRRQCYRVMRG